MARWLVGVSRAETIAMRRRRRRRTMMMAIRGLAWLGRGCGGGGW
jgi:hypothetical protein